MINSAIYHIDTRIHVNFHEPSMNLTKYQNWVYYVRVKVFNMLPSYIKIESDNPKKYKLILQKLFSENFFYFCD